MRRKKINKTDRSVSVSLATSSRDGERFLRAGALTASGTLALQSFILLFCLFAAACEPAPSMMENRAATPLPVTEPSEKLTSLEKEIRDAEGFSVVLVFKRKDGGVFDSEDKKYISANKPSGINRAILTDDEKALVVGSNFLFPPENMVALRKRFVVEDHSKAPVKEPPANTNQRPKGSK
jgi:hypothetical protein